MDKATARRLLAADIATFQGEITLCEPAKNGRRTIKAKNSRVKPGAIQPMGLPTSGSRIHRTIHPSRLTATGKVSQDY